MEIISKKIQPNNEKTIKILGITVYKKSLVHYKNRVWTKRKLLFGIFKTLENNDCKLYYFCGIRIIKVKKKTNLQKLLNSYNLANLHNNLNRNIQKNISVSIQHQKVFSKYKNIYNNKTVVVYATGPSLNYFDIDFKNSINVGLNASFKKENLKLDYLFMQDYYAVKDYIEDVPKYVNYPCKLFYGYTMEYNTKPINRVIPESIAIRHNAERYYTDWANIKNFKPSFVYDITTQPLGCFGSIVFPAMQFILFTNPSKIYLVGCDCSDGHYDNSPMDNSCKHLVNAWISLKNFVNIYYPETEIISVNPVGLKGLFKDMYTKSFLNAHPEIITDNVIM